ncbi:MAG: hypothetical protein WDN06_00240 [Asticcacaulis sp.]
MDADIVAGASQRQGDGAADALGCAGNQGDTKAFFYRRPSRSCRGRNVKKKAGKTWRSVNAAEVDQVEGGDDEQEGGEKGNGKHGRLRRLSSL